MVGVADVIAGPVPRTGLQAQTSPPSDRTREDGDDERHGRIADEQAVTEGSLDRGVTALQVHEELDADQKYPPFTTDLARLVHHIVRTDAKRHAEAEAHAADLDHQATYDWSEPLVRDLRVLAGRLRAGQPIRVLEDSPDLAEFIAIFWDDLDAEVAARGSAS